MAFSVDRTNARQGLTITSRSRGSRCAAVRPAGLTEKHDAALKEALGITTIRQLGANKYFAVAGVLVALEGKTG